MSGKSLQNVASLCSIALLLALPLAAGDAALDDILRRLDAGDVEEREAAEAELVRHALTLGEPGARALRERLAGAPPEVRARVEDALDLVAQVDRVKPILTLLDALGIPDVREGRFVLGGQDADGNVLLFHWEIAAKDGAVTWVGVTERGFSRPFDGGSDRQPEADFEAYLLRIHCTDWTPAWRAVDPELYVGTLGIPGDAILAAWALQRDLPSGAVELILKAEATIEDRRRKWEGQGWGDRNGLPPTKCLLGQVAVNVCHLACLAAVRGESAPLLARRWRQAAALPENPSSLWAREMLAVYDELTETEPAPPPSPDRVDAGGVADRTAFNVHLLLDARKDGLIFAARWLWRTRRDERGIRIVVGRLDAMGPVAARDVERDAEMYTPALDVLVEWGEDFAAEAVCRYMRSERRNLSVAAIRAARDLPHPGIVRTLMQDFEEDDRDREACDSLHVMLGGTVPPEVARHGTAPGASMDAMRAWWGPRGQELDWAALKREATERHARRAGSARPGR